MSASQEILHRNNVKVIGKGSTTLILAHGFGCDQNMWRFLTPLLDADFRIVLFDYVGCGKSDLSAYKKQRYQNLAGYAEDVEEILSALNVVDAIFVGHSVSSVIGMLASYKIPERFSKLVMICPSPCFLNLPQDYFGGFEREDLEELINLMDKNYIGWANYLAPLVMGDNNSPELTRELTSSFCSTDPKFAKPFAKATFFSDHRSALDKLEHPTLILQSSNDSLASVDIGHYMQNKIRQSTMEIIQAYGHCLHMTTPSIVADKIRTFCC